MALLGARNVFDVGTSQTAIAALTMSAGTAIAARLHLSSQEQPLTSTSAPSETRPTADSGGTRTKTGSTYGDFAPTPEPGLRDPSRGAEFERDSMPADGDFSRPPVEGDPAESSREARIRAAAFEKFQQRSGSEGDPVTDWLQAEAEVDAALADPVARRA